MKYLGPPYFVGDRVRWLCWKHGFSGLAHVRYGWVKRVEPARSMHGPTLTVCADDVCADDGGYEILLPGLHGAFKVSAVEALAELVR